MRQFSRQALCSHLRPAAEHRGGQRGGEATDVATVPLCWDFQPGVVRASSWRQARGSDRLTCTGTAVVIGGRGSRSRSHHRGGLEPVKLAVFALLKGTFPKRSFTSSHVGSARTRRWRSGERSR